MQGAPDLIAFAVINPIVLILDLLAQPQNTVFK